VTAALAAFAMAFVSTLWLVRLGRSGARVRALGLDRDFDKPQGVHTTPTPRIGGIAIVLGIIVGAALSATWQEPGALVPLVLLACSLPAFVAGVAHDMTESLSPRGRLVATAISAALAFLLLDAALRQTAIPGLDWIVSFGAGALIVTVFAVAGIAHAINIIDGLNGLAAMCVVIMLAALAYVCYQVSDPMLMTLSLVVIGSVIGFFVWNFPSGLVFLGDGGAYFLGFMVAEIGILLLARNAEVSPLFPLLVCIYPVFETLFSVYRRVWLRQLPASGADGIHLHTLLYKRVMRWAVEDGPGLKEVDFQNAKTSPILWVLCSLSAAPAVLFWDDTVVLALFLVVFAITYVVLYQRLVRFRAPRWIRAWASAPITRSSRGRRPD